MNNLLIITTLLALVRLSLGKSCRFNDKYYGGNNTKLPGACAQLNCNTDEGEWEVEGGSFTDNDCCFRCNIRDDPHHKTFNKCSYENHHKCKFSLVQTGRRNRPYTAIYNSYRSCGTHFPGKSCLGYLTFKTFPGCVVKFNPIHWWALKKVKVGSKNKFLTQKPKVICQKSWPKMTTLAWFDPGDECLIIMGHRGLLVRFCVKEHDSGAKIHFLDIWTPQVYNNYLYGLCNKFSVKDQNKLVTRQNKKVDCKNPKDFIHSWAIKPHKCPGNSRTMDIKEDRCPAHTHKMMTQRCADALKDVDLDDEERKDQIDFCVEDTCAMARSEAHDQKIEDFIQLTRDSIIQFSVAPLRHSKVNHGQCKKHTGPGDEHDVHWMACQILFNNSFSENDNSTETEAEPDYEDCEAADNRQ